MKKILPYLKPYLLQIIIVIGLISVQVTTDLALPDYLADIINKGVVFQDNDVIFSIGAEMIGVAMIGAVATVIVGFLASKISTGAARDLRKGLYTKIQNFSSSEYDKFSTASLLTRSTNDVQQIQTVIFMFLRLVISAPIMGIGAVIKAYDSAPDMSWLIALAVGTLFSVISVVFVLAVPKFRLLQKLVDKINQVSRENLTGLRVIRAFNTQKKELQKFDEVNTDLTKVSLFTNKLMIALQPIMFLIFNLTTVGVVWFGAHLLNDGLLEIGGMLAFMQYAMQVIMSFLMLTMVIIFMTRAAVSIQRIGEVLKTDSSVKDPDEPVKFKKEFKGNIEYKDVSFAYANSDEAVIKKLSFTAKDGETTAFIGSTGSGKSTIINLLPRFHDVTEGSILIDGIDIREVSQKDLRDKIGYVPQKGSLFSGTIKSNIKYGNEDATEKELKEAAEISQAYEFISKYDDEFDNPITQGATNVSGGQKQRLSIARAVVKKPEIFIFDDSFSALDLKTDAALRKALDENTKNATVLVVAQRISTIKSADKIIVLNKGKIAGEGTHDELMKDCRVYKEIALSQLSEEELDIKKLDKTKEK
jgi:ATP-binding cassette, subfamily B, multidrug efflux pump